MEALRSDSDETCSSITAGNFFIGSLSI